MISVLTTITTVNIYTHTAHGTRSVGIPVKREKRWYQYPLEYIIYDDETKRSVYDYIFA